MASMLTIGRVHRAIFQVVDASIHAVEAKALLCAGHLLLEQLLQCKCQCDPEDFQICPS